MGRIAGVTAAETRERLLRAAADAFADRGFDGTRVAAIAAAAGVSNGGYLMVEALVAARRDEDVARPMRDYVRERADWLAGLMRSAQDGGELDPALSPDALAHFCLLLAMGSALIVPDMPTAGRTSGLHCFPDGAGSPAGIPHDRNSTVKVQIDAGRCQGHGRCYDLAPGLFGDDDEGYGQVLGDGQVPPGQEDEARLAAANCPEQAVILAQGA